MVPEEDLSPLQIRFTFNARDQVNCKKMPLDLGRPHPSSAEKIGCAYTLPVILMTGSDYPSYFPFETQRIGWLLSGGK